MTEGKGEKRKMGKKGGKAFLIISLPSLTYTTVTPSTLPASVRYNYAFLPSPIQAAYTS